MSKIRRRDAVGLLTALREEERGARALARMSNSNLTDWKRMARRYAGWARWVKAVLNAGAGGQ
jgi:hypothetical protein